MSRVLQAAYLNGAPTYVLWTPSLKRGAPSNGVGARGSGWYYVSRKAAVEHERWANQAPWRSARRVRVRVADVTEIEPGVFVASQLAGSAAMWPIEEFRP